MHLNRVIKTVRPQHDLHLRSRPRRPGGGRQHVYLEGTYSEVYPNISQDEAGLKKLFKQFSFPGGISSHVSPQTPGSIHEGGELGYSLSHAFGAVFDNPDLVVACVVGDGEAETGPLATAWHSNKFLNPVTDGVVLPILHLNGYKISNPTVLARITHEELEQLLRGYGWTPYFVEGARPGEDASGHGRHPRSGWSSKSSRSSTTPAPEGDATRPRWPMIVLKSPKGWTGPKFVDGLPVEGTFRAHQVPLSVSATSSSRASQAARELAEKLQAGRTLRRARPARARTGRAGAEGRPADGRQSPRQRRDAAPRPAHAGLPQLRGRACPRRAPPWPEIRTCWAGSFAT